METSNYSCTFDTDCPGLKKCCNSSIGAGCVTPLPGERNLRKYWFNASVLVKMDFNELHRIDPRLLNHSRLLHALMTGALQPFHSSVYHIQTAHAETYSGTVISHILIGLYQPASLITISSLLKAIMKRVYEVIDVDVQDVNECSYAELNACPQKELCINMEGFYSCTCEPEHMDTNSSHLSGGCKESTTRSTSDPVSTSNSSVSLDNSTIVLPKSENSTDSECYSSAIRNHRIFSVTSCSFEISWSVNSTLNHTFQVEVFKDKDIFKSMATTEMRVDVSDLEAGIMYLVKISYETCGKTIISHQSAKTNAQIFGITIRILNYNFTEQLHNTSSLEYQEFSRLLLTEIGNSFPPNISTLYTTGKLKVQIESLKAGSILVRLRVIIQDPEFSTDASSFAPVLSYLYKGSVFLVDQQSSSVGDWDECAFPSENDCSMYAECINAMGSYRCRCKTTMDTNPSRPGRNCEGEIVNPVTETMPSENVGVHKLNSTVDKEIGRENNTWSEKYLKESFSVSTTRPDFSPASNTMNFLTTDCIPATAQRIILYNVSSTSFHAAWSTESTQNPVFRFLLLREDQLIWETKTRSRHLTVTGLELGVFYTVTIGTEVCMKETKSAHLKVYKSMPLNLIQQMDDGMIKMSITSITNGSIVVGFSLVIAEDLDIQYIATAFRDAFQHSSYFTADNNSVSIHDYDECKREEDDCSAEASCHNIYGSYQCSCNEGFIDLNSDRPGRNCKAFPPSGSPAATDDNPAGSTVFPMARSLPWAHVSSLAAEDSFATKPKVLEHAMFSSSAVPQASLDSMSNVYHSPPVTPLPFIASAQRLSIKDAVKVFCEIEKIVIAIQKKFLQQESIPESSLYLGEPHCNVSFSNDTSVVLQTGWNECAAEVQSNLTNTLVKTILRNDISLQGVIHHLKIVSPIHCVFQNDLLTSSGYTPEWVYTIFEDLHGSGHFITEMQLFVGNSPIPKNFSISASDDILIEVGIYKEGSKLKVVLTECWATPSNNSMDPLSFVFIKNSCPVPNTYTSLIENGNSSKAQFKLKIFSFVNNSVVYLHCRIRICVETPESTCRTTCNGARSLKTGEIIATHRTSWGPLCKAAASDSKTRKEPGLGVGYRIWNLSHHTDSSGFSPLSSLFPLALMMEANNQSQY
ncbi:uromodulin-like 1 isoform C [Alligator mississippiensis]|uniref:Uromodulin-like 1 isoform C n=1 Tax=Alligator mississippiensis TaxID=8496 RepID=A0A151MEC2_ALLMI|nr:uromodulin-like 1 isoform C [Alligator mississippiensis]